MEIKRLVGLMAILFAVLFSSCDGSSEEIDDTEDSDSTSVEIDVFESPDVDYHLPSALQVASIFKKSGLKYNAGVTNPTTNSNNYSTDVQQKLNFGIYSADLAYCVINEQSNEARKYLTVIKQLAEVQGMDAVFDNEDLMTRFDKNLEIKDSIEIIMIEIHERTEEYMADNDMLHISAIHYAGAWVEGMYLGVYDFEKNKDKNDVGAQITEQMEILGNIIKGLQDPKNSGTDLDWVISDLQKIQNTFDGFETVKAFYEDANAVELTLTKEEFSSLAELIKDLRSKIVNA